MNGLFHKAVAKTISVLKTANSFTGWALTGAKMDVKKDIPQQISSDGVHHHGS